MKSSIKNWPYAAFGGCGALTGISLATNCSGACTACFGCVVAGGSLAVLAMVRTLKNKSKESADGVVKASD